MVEVLLPDAPDLLQPRIVGTSFRCLARLVELRAQQRPHRAEAIAATLQARREAEESEACVAALFHQSGILQQAEMTRHA
jgi:hypothetical protein